MIRRDVCYRCSTCGISYPTAGKCQVCEGALDGIQDKPDPDWKEKVALLLAPRPESEDKAANWRVEQLLYAGAPMRVAERVAADRSIDLHKATDLFRKAGPELAEAILL